jgi:hypothetical protein
MGAVQRAAPQLSLFPEEPFPAAEKPGELPGFSVRVSGRARRLSIKVYPRGRVEVVVPRRTRPADVQSFVTDNRDWIRRAREAFVGDAAEEAFALPHSIDLPAIGRRLTVQYAAIPGARSVRWRLTGDTLTLSGRVGDAAHCVDALRRCLATIAKAEFAPRLVTLSALTGIAYERMQVRAQRTCWGSRSCSGTISLNLCLMFLAPELLRYLMLHELCHGRYMNHSRRFWNLVGRFAPDYRDLDRELGESWRAVPVWMGVC